MLRPLLLAVVLAVVVAPRGSTPWPAAGPGFAPAAVAAAGSGFTPAARPLPGAFVADRPEGEPGLRFSARRGEVTWFFAPDTIALQRPDGPGSVCNLLLRFEGAGPDARVEGVGPATGRVNLYRGADPSRWVVGAPVFEAIQHRDVYPGVDLRVHDGPGRLEYDVALAPGADPRDVVVRCDGADGLELQSDGSLVVSTPAGPVVQSIPACWQVRSDGRREALAARFRLMAGGPVAGAPRFGFEVPGRDPALALVIDPALTYGTFLGGVNWDKVTAVARGAGNTAWVAGFTTSPGFPVTGGAVQRSLAGYADAFVARLDLLTGALLWSTFLGGDDNAILVGESATGLAVDAAGRVYVSGWANAADFPATVGSYAPTYAGGTDAFVMRLGSDGALQWSSFLGGGKDDRAEAVALAADGVLVAGRTFSNDVPPFPTTAGAFDTTFNSIFASDDAFVSKLSLDGATLSWSTLVGGVLRDEALGIAVDGAGAPTVTGLTGSTDFPTTPGAWDTTYNGLSASEWNAFVLKLQPGGNALAWSTYLGGQLQAEGHAVALDAAGAPTVAGVARTTDFPVTAGALQTVFGGGASDAFVTRLAAGGASLQWSTFLGGTGDDEGNALALDSAGAPVVAGTTSSANFPVTAGAASGTLRGPTDAFVAKIRGGGSNGAPGGGNALLAATYAGGSADDLGLALALDVHGAALLGGETHSTDLPLTAGAIDASYNGGGDGFLQRLPLPPWADMGFAKAGTAGLPQLAGVGSLVAGTPGALALTSGKPNSLAVLLGGFAAGFVPLKGGTLVPFPIPINISLATSALGTLTLPFAAWPTGLPPGFAIYFQVWISDPAATVKAAASNGLQAIQP